MVRTGVEILEATLRDGSYTINNQFTATDTEVIVRILDEIGFKYIEIGCGVGLNAQKVSKIKPAATDVEYIQAAKKSSKKSKIGMFFISGIGEKEHIKEAGEAGLDFIRCGENITEFRKAFEYLSFSKSLGLMTSLNLMKSYILPPKDFALVADEAFQNGADIVYLVDSAGGMFPDEIENYYKATLDRNPAIKLGFHGHDNLSLGIANTLRAIKCGAPIVDSTIRGMGRSSGNVVTEKLLLILDRLDYEVEYDIDKLFQLSDEVFLPLLKDKLENSTDYIFGYSQFHSSFLSTVKKVADEYDVDPNQLIINYTKIDKMNIDELKLQEIARGLEHKKRFDVHITSDIKYNSNREQQLQVLRDKMIELINKYGKKVFFNISKTYENIDLKISPVTHQSENVVFSSAELSESAEISLIFDSFDDIADGYLIDTRLSLNEKDFTGKKAFFYDDAELFARTVRNYLKKIIALEKNAKTVFIDIYSDVEEYLSFFLDKLGVTRVNTISSANIAVIGKNFIDKGVIDKANQLNWVIVTVPGKLDKSITDSGAIKNIIRIDMETEVFTEIIEAVNHHRNMTEKFGAREFDGILYCSGGYIGKEGAVVVDDYSNIKYKYGISKGDGSIKYFE